MNGKGNGNGRNAISPRVDDVPWEEVRALVWELRRCRDLCFEPHSAVAVRVVDGEKFTTGYSEAKQMVAIDLTRMVDKLGREISYHRQQRFEDWVAGRSPWSLGKVEQIQLKADVRRMEEMVIEGGYQFMLRRYDASEA